MAFYTADYSEVDSILYDWAHKYSLKIRTEHKDFEVRYIDIAGNSGKLYQIWIDPPNEKKEVGIHAWDYFVKRKIDAQAPLSDVGRNLEEIYSIIMLWDKEFAKELAKYE
jgi:hypothetical protein